jgi:hypothetical protein
VKEAWRGRGEAFLCILLCHFRFHATPLRLAFKNWKISPESCKKRKIICKVSEKKRGGRGSGAVRPGSREGTPAKLRMRIASKASEKSRRFH